MKIFSASRREDMVAFQYPELIKEYHKHKDNFWVFWTKDPTNLIDANLDHSKVALQLTITGLPKTIEPGVPNTERIIETTKQLVNNGWDPRLINWRFDPIVNDSCLVNFEMIASELSSVLIKRCIISFLTMYPKVRSRVGSNLLKEYTKDEQIGIIEKMLTISDRYDIELFGCAQPHLVKLIRPSNCIDAEYYSTVTGLEFDSMKDPSQRKSCGCSVSIDIGKYRTCGHKCLYCYARPEE